MEKILIISDEWDTILQKVKRKMSFWRSNQVQPSCDTRFLQAIASLHLTN